MPSLCKRNMFRAYRSAGQVTAEVATLRDRQVLEWAVTCGAVSEKRVGGYDTRRVGELDPTGFFQDSRAARGTNSLHEHLGVSAVLPVTKPCDRDRLVHAILLCRPRAEQHTAIYAQHALAMA